MKLLQRISLAIASTKAGARIYRAVLPTVDRLVLRATDGQRTFSGLFLPTLNLTTTGRRSGRPREQPLVYLEDRGDLIVVGSNWGQAHHPAWTHNLLAKPAATVTVAGEEIPVRAQLVDGTEGERLFQRFADMAPNYGNYGDWAGGREIRVFRLRPRS